MDITKRRRASKLETGQQVVGLYEKLVEVEKPLSPEELFKQVDLKVEDQPESVGIFHVELDADESDGWIAIDRVSGLLQALDLPAEAEEQAATEEAPALPQAVQEQTMEEAPKTAQITNIVSRPTLWHR